MMMLLLIKQTTFIFLNNKKEGDIMKYETKERVENFLEMLINQIEENGMMEYDGMRETVLDEAKELLELITNNK